MKEGRPVISASEVGQFAYCRRAWWLARVAGLEPADPERLRFGQRAHARHGRAVRAALLGQRLAYALLAVGLAAGLILLLLSLLAGAA